MEKELISIIVPVYQAEQYLVATIESVLQQTYQHWELILVDDGSKDNSGRICDEYALKDLRIRVLHQTNQGVSAARNQGIQAAQGAYISFIDSDDLIAEDYLEVLYRDMIEQDVDVVCCNALEEYRGVRRDYHVVNSNRRIVGEHSKESCYQDVLLGKECYLHFNSSKLIKAAIVKRHRYHPICYGEDRLFMMEVIADSPAVYLDAYPGYIYVRRDSSATFKYGAKYVPNFMDALFSSQFLFHQTQSMNDRIRCMAAEHHAYGIHSAAAATVITGRKSFHEQRRKLRMYIEELKPCYGLLSVKNRLRLQLYEYIPVVYWLCIKTIGLLGRT